MKTKTYNNSKLRKKNSEFFKNKIQPQFQTLHNIGKSQNLILENNKHS